MIASGMTRPYAGERMWRPRRMDGTLRDMRCRTSRYFRARAKPVSWARSWSITDRVLAEELRLNAQELQKALTRAEAANTAKSEFLATMSHELRTPLNAILGFSEILQNETFGPVGNAPLPRIRTQHSRQRRALLGVINDILDLSRLDSGTFRLHLEAGRSGRCRGRLHLHRRAAGGLHARASRCAARSSR